MNEFKIATKKLSWTLKFEGDAIKAPDVKPAPANVFEIKSTLEGSVTVPAQESCKAHAVTTIPLSSVPENHDIVAIVVKLEGTVPKDFTPLKVSRCKLENASDWSCDDLNAKELPDKNQSPAIVYFKLLDGVAPPTRIEQLSVTNCNGTEAKLSVQIAYMESKAQSNKAAPLS